MCDAGCDRKAEPGDVIIITRKHEYEGEKFTVVKCPEDRRGEVNEHCPWVKYKGETYCITKRADYKIIEYSHSTKSTDVLLKKQMDDNLRSVFG